MLLVLRALCHYSGERSIFYLPQDKALFPSRSRNNQVTFTANPSSYLNMYNAPAKEKQKINTHRKPRAVHNGIRGRYAAQEFCVLRCPKGTTETRQTDEI